MRRDGHRLHVRRRRLRVRCGEDGPVGREVARLDHDGGRDGEAGRDVGDVDPDRPVEPVDPVRLHRERPPGTGEDGGVQSFDGQVEIVFRRADAQPVGGAVRPAAARIGYADQVRSRRPGQ